jgi:hypothetical protein
MTDEEEKEGEEEREGEIALGWVWAFCWAASWSLNDFCFSLKLSTPRLVTSPSEGVLDCTADAVKARVTCLEADNEPELFARRRSDMVTRGELDSWELRCWDLVLLEKSSADDVVAEALSVVGSLEWKLLVWFK